MGALVQQHRSHSAIGMHTLIQHEHACTPPQDDADNTGAIADTQVTDQPQPATTGTR